MDQKAKPFDPSKPVQTRDGKAARIIATDKKGQFPIVALLTMPDGNEELFSVTRDGRSSTTMHLSSFDLINIPEKHTVWLNCYLGHCGDFYPTREAADLGRSSNRIACVKVEFEEGEGLS